MKIDNMKLWKIYVNGKLVEIIPMGIESGLVVGWLQGEYGNNNVKFNIMSAKEMKNDEESLNWVNTNYNFFGKRTSESIINDIKKKLQSL